MHAEAIDVQFPGLTGVYAWVWGADDPTIGAIGLRNPGTPSPPHWTGSSIQAARTAIIGQSGTFCGSIRTLTARLVVLTDRNWGVVPSRLASAV